MTKRGLSLKIFFAAVAVLPFLIDRRCSGGLNKGDCFTLWVCRGRDLVRVERVSAVRRARGNALLNIAAELYFVDLKHLKSRI